MCPQKYGIQIDQAGPSSRFSCGKVLANLSQGPSETEYKLLIIKIAPRTICVQGAVLSYNPNNQSTETFKTFEKTGNS